MYCFFHDSTFKTKILTYAGYRFKIIISRKSKHSPPKKKNRRSTPIGQREGPRACLVSVVFQGSHLFRGRWDHPESCEGKDPRWRSTNLPGCSAGGSGHHDRDRMLRCISPNLRDVSSLLVYRFKYSFGPPSQMKVYRDSLQKVEYPPLRRTTYRFVDLNIFPKSHPISWFLWRKPRHPRVQQKRFMG